MSDFKVVAEPGSHEVVVTRTFNAPAAAIFRAYTDPAVVPSWWGPSSFTTKVDRLDVRFGGTWRFTQTDPDHNEFGFRGIYHEVVPDERLVYTFEFEGEPGHLNLTTMTLEEKDGKTRLTNRVVFQSVKDRDAMMEAGDEDGERQGFDRLAEIVETA